MNYYLIYTVLASIFITPCVQQKIYARRMALFYPLENRRSWPVNSARSAHSPPSPVFTHSAFWKSKSTTKKPIDTTTKSNLVLKSEHKNIEETDADLEVTQFHTQDGNGKVIFGFNSPDQMRVETRNPDGTVHGTYSYIDPYGQLVKRQYWDNGSGFHVTSNSVPYDQSNSQASQYSSDGHSARDLHLQLYRQALSSFLPLKEEKQNETLENIPTTTIKAVEIKENVNKSTTAEKLRERILRINNDERTSRGSGMSDNEVNGTIIIQNPEYLRISWATDARKARNNLFKISK